MKNDCKGRNTKTIVSKKAKLKSIIVFILSFTLILLPNLIAFAENESGVQGTPTPTVSQAPETTPSDTTSDEPDTIPSDTISEKTSTVPSENPSSTTSEEPSNSSTPAPSEDESKIPSDSPTNSTSTEPSGEVTPGPSEPPPEEPTDSSTPDPSEEESSEPSAENTESASTKPSESLSEEPALKPAVAPLAMVTLNSISLTSGNGINPVEHAGNDSSANAPSGYTWISIGNSTLTKYFDINGNPTASGPYFFTMNVGTVREKIGITSWSSNMIIYSVIAKGGPKYNEYIYNGGHLGDTNLSAPINASNGKPYDLSHASFVYKVPPPPEPGSLKLIKKDDLGNLLANVEFRLTDNDTFNDTKTTNSSGEIFWDNLDPGTYYLHETVPTGYLPPGTNPITVVVGDNQNVILTLVNTKDRRGDFKVYKVDDDKNPLAGAVFTLTPLGGGTAIAGVESPAGTHSWTNLPIGSYTLKETTVPSGYNSDSSLPKTVVVYEGSDGRNVFTAVNNRETGSFKVYKKDKNMNLLAGAVFTLTPVSGGSAITGTENSTGLHTWSNLPTGDYILDETVVPTGYTKGANLPRTITITDGSSESVIIINTRKVGNFTVYKKDGNGAALKGAVFTLTPLAGGSPVTGTENPDGTHTWANLPTGDYTLDETVVPTGYSKGANLPRKVTVNEGSNAAITVVNERKVGSFTVYKKDDKGTALAGAVFTLTPLGGGTAVTGVENPSGVHSWSSLPTGDYTLTETTVPSGYTADPTLPITITVFEGNDARNVFTAVNTRKLGDFTVYKKDQDSAALAGAVFTLTPVGGGTPITGVESPAGTHTWTNIPTGDYTLDETVVPTGYSKGANLPRTVTVNQGSNAAVTITNTRKLGNFTVYKKDNNGAALAGAVFTLTPLGGGAAITGSESPAGTHTWTNLPTGSYTLTETVVPAGYNGATSLPTTVIVYEGSDARNVFVAINNRKVGDYIVYKVDEDKEALAGAEFTLTPITGGPAIKGVEGPSGTHTWSGLPTGVYTLDESVVPTGYTKDPTLPKPVVVAEGSNTAVTAVNTRKVGDFTVYKKDDKGATLAGAVFTLTPDGGGTPIIGVESSPGTHTWVNLPTGDYTLKETTVPSGYSGDTNLPKTVTVYEGNDARSVFTAVNTLDVGDFTVYKKDQDKNTLAGAVFTLTPVGGGTAITGVESPAGTHTWSNLPVGNYTLTETTVPTGYTGDPTLPTTVTVYLGADARNVYTAVNTRKLGDFVVKKTDGDDQPLAGAVFTLTPIGGGAAITGVENPDGTHSWTGLPTGDYTLDETTVPTDYNKGANLPRTVTVNQGTNDTVTIVNERKVGNFTVYKKDDKGAALAGAVFTLTPVGGGTAITGVESPDGTHSWTDLPTGSYTLTETTVPNGYLGDTNLPKTVMVYEGNDARNVFTAVNNPDIGDFTVYKKDQDRAALAGAVFTLTPVGGGAAITGVESPDGTHTWTGIPTGDYTLTETTVPTGYTGDPTLPTTVTVYLGADSRNVYTAINTRKLGDFVVKKTDGDDQPLAGAVFTLTPASGGTAITGVESPDGTHSWTGLPTGDYTLDETTVPTDYNKGDNLPRTVTVNQGTNDTVTIVNERKVGDFVVYKVDGNEEPLAGAVFYLTPDGGVTKYYSVESPAGTHSWTNLPTGEYMLYESTVPTGYTPDPLLPKTVTVYEGSDEKNEFTAVNDPEHCSLLIFKKDTNGELIVGLNITFKLELDNGDGTFTLISEKSSTTGKILWDDLEPGDYRLTEVSAPDGYFFDTVTHNVTLANGEDKEKDITNEEYVTIQVIKRDKLTGQVLAGAVFEISESTPPLGDVSLNAIAILGRATTNAQGIATFAYPDFKLKAGVTYTVTEVTPPPGYQNDSTPLTITVSTPGGINSLEVGLFENTPILQKITVVKYLDEVMTSTIGDGTLFDGTEFQLWQGTTYLESKYLSGGTLEFTDLPPGDYIIKEIAGLTTTSFNVDTDKNVTLVLKTQENIDSGLTDPIVNFYNTYDNGDFAIIKHDADDFEIVLQGAVYHLTGMHWTGTEYVETTYVLTTDINGYAEVKDLTPGNYTLKEFTPPDGYKIDETTYNVVIYSGRTTEGEDIYHVSDEKFEPGSIVIAKFEEGNTTVRLAGVRFSLYKDSVSTANLIGTALTDVNGNIVWSNLEPGDYIVVEDATLSGYTIVDASKNITLPSAGYEIVIFYNRPTTTPTPTPTTPTFPPESTPTPSPSPSPTPSPTPTPIETDELIIEDVDPAFGPETGEGDALFIAVGILLLIGGALFILRKRFITSQ